MMRTEQHNNIHDIALDEEVRELIGSSMSSYRRAGIDISILSVGEREVSVLVKQSRLINGYILNNRQLYKRAKEVFSPLEERGWKVKVTPSVHSLDVSGIDLDWVHQRMEEFGVKRKDLVQQLAIDKSSLSLILSGKRDMSKSMKATFFYYFLTYELNRDLRSML